MDQKPDQDNDWMAWFLQNIWALCAAIAIMVATVVSESGPFGGTSLWAKVLALVIGVPVVTATNLLLATVVGFVWRRSRKTEVN